MVPGSVHREPTNSVSDCMRVITQLHATFRVSCHRNRNMRNIPLFMLPKCVCNLSLSVFRQMVASQTRRPKRRSTPPSAGASTTSTQRPSMQKVRDVSGTFSQTFRVTMLRCRFCPPRSGMTAHRTAIMGATTP